MSEWWSHSNPVRIVGGPDLLEQLPTWTKPGRILLVTSPGFTRRGVTERVVAMLGPDRVSVVDQCTPNPDLDDVDALTASCRRDRPDQIIALGGGSVLDTAKTLSVTIPHERERPLHALFRECTSLEWGTAIPVVAMPTTSGTGAEVTPFATVWGTKEKKKYSVATPFLFPEIAIMDPLLTGTLPEHETLHTGLDAVSHAMESLWNTNRTPLSVCWAVASLEYSLKALPAVLDTPSDVSARGDMQMASLLAGLAISQTRTAMAHSMSYPLTLHYGVPHGLACSYTLPAIHDLLMKRRPDWLAPWQDLLDEVVGMLSCLSLPSRITKYAALDQVLERIPEMRTQGRSDNFIVEVDDDDLADVLRHSIS